MNIQFDKLSTKQFFNWMANKIFELMIPELLVLVKSNLNDEELLSKKELCKEILKCDENTADKYFLNAKGFPYIEMGNRRKYPKKQVELWISKNTRFD